MMKKKTNVININTLDIEGSLHESTNGSTNAGSPTEDTHLATNGNSIYVTQNTTSPADKAAQENDQYLREILAEDARKILIQIKNNASADNVSELVIRKLIESHLLSSEILSMLQANSNGRTAQLDNIVNALLQPSVPVTTLQKSIQILETQLNAYLDLDSDVSLFIESHTSTPVDKDAEEKITKIQRLCKTNAKTLEDAVYILTLINCDALSHKEKLDIIAKHAEVELERDISGTVNNTRFCHAFSAQVLRITRGEEEIQQNGKGLIAKK